MEQESSGRAPVLVASAGIALGAGLMVYRWFVLGWSWHGDTSTVLLVLSVGLIAGGAQLARTLAQRPRQPPWWLRMAIAVPAFAAGMGVGFAIAPTPGHIALHDRELHGVTIGRPDGKPDADSDDPIAGKVFLTEPGGFEGAVGVQWSTGEALDDDGARATIAALAATQHGQAALIEHDDFVVGDAIAHRSASIAKDDVLGWMTMFGCGSRQYVVISVGSGADALHRRMLASVRCRPDPRDAPAEPPIALDLPTGWQEQPGSPGQRLYAGPGGDVGLLVGAAARLDESDVGEIANAMGTAMGGALQLGARHPEGGRSMWSGTMTLQGEAMAVLVSFWACPDRGLSLFAMYVHPTGTDEQPGIDLISKARCK
jgi:hypothetical protein